MEIKDEEIARRIFERQRGLTPAERLQEALELGAYIRNAQTMAVKREFPDADELEVKLRAASRWIRNPELLKGAFGWDVEERGF